jgi:outer membrane protein OmpA-like peptidoglycan-associated protein
VGLSIIFFFIFSAGHLSRRKAVSQETPPDAPAAVKPVSPAAKPPVPGDAKTAVPAGNPATPVYFTTAEALVKEVAARLTTGKAEVVEKLAGTGPRTRLLLDMLSTGGFRVSAASPWVEAGSMAGGNRYELNLEPPPAGPVAMDIERTKTEGWKVKALRFDPAFVAQAAEILKTKGVAVNPGAVTDTPDALDQSRRFLTGVLSHNFKAARSLTDQVKVTHERLAGMCIVFEEGEYRVAEKRPVVVTAGTENTAWAIIKVRSDKQNLDSEVGLEMERTPGGAWIIHALDFNKMLEGYVKATGTGNVFYSPIVKSAKGGESIVLYFEFDKSELHPRALHQLDIISSLLKSDPARKMRITGHSDALGTDDYNVRLSAARAKNVRDRLLQLGVSATQIVTAGVGSKAPLDPDRRADGSDNPDGRSRNRRTEIYLDF